MPRYFTLSQAERLLPKIEDFIRTALALKLEFSEAEGAFQDLTRKVMMSGGMALDRERVLEIRQRRDRSAETLRDLLERIQETGVLVKDLDIGLLDFPTLYGDREVYLCWKLGETHIEFWHEIEAGFRGRRQIDAEFLNKHHT